MKLLVEKIQEMSKNISPKMITVLHGWSFRCHQISESAIRQTVVFRKLLRKVPANSVFSESKLASIHSPTYFSTCSVFSAKKLPTQKTELVLTTSLPIGHGSFLKEEEIPNSIFKVVEQTILPR